MEQDVDPTVQHRRLRVALRQARRDRGYTQEQVAKAMDWSLSKVARIESGGVGVSTTDLRALLGHYGITDERRRSEYTRMAQSSRTSSRTTTWGSYRDVLDSEFLRYLGFEGSASVLRQFEPLVVPGLLQTHKYAEVVINAYRQAETTDQEAARQLAARMARQELLAREDRPELRFVLDEAVVRRAVGTERGDPTVMPEQLAWLKEVAARPGVTIQIVPFAHGFYPGMRGSFVLLDFPDPADPAMLFIENTHGALATREKLDDINLFADRFSQLEQLALDSGDSLDLIDVAIFDLRTE